MEDSGPRTISLVVKTPSRGEEDQTLAGVPLDWTVKQLKTHLSAVCPSRPAESEQRLIYAGKLLLDHLHIRELFRQTDSTPTLHLVCAARNPTYASLGARPKNNEAHQRRPSPAASPAAAAATAAAATAAAAPGSSSSSSPSAEPPSSLRQRRPASSAPAHTHTPAPPTGSPTAAAAAAATPPAPPLTPAAFPAMSLYSPQQLLWLQHVYAHQYYMQYQAALAAAGSAPPPTAATLGQYAPVPAHQVPVPAPLANQNPMDNLPANQNPVQDGGFMDGGGANQNLAMNAQGGAVVEDEEDAERDWLDWIYSAARFCVLLTIVYFNSNLSRFLMVMSTLLLMYLHTVGWFPFRRPAQAQGPDHQQPPEVRHNQANENRNPNAAEEPAGRPREEPDAGQSEAAMTAVLVPPHRVSPMWTAWVFFKTFFSSLIPEAAQGVAN